MTACAGFGGYVAIPHMSPDGVLPASPSALGAGTAYIDRVCGADFGLTGGVAGPLVCKFKFFASIQKPKKKTLTLIFQLHNNLLLWGFSLQAYKPLQRDSTWNIPR